MTKLKERAAGNPATGDKFYSGYEHYVTSLEQKLEKGSHNLLAIFGARRIGKTTSIKEYFQRLQKKGQDESPVGIYIDVENINDPKDMIDKIISRIEEEASEGRPLSSKLKSFKKRHQEALATWTSGVSGKIGGDISQGSISSEIKITKYSFDKTMEFLRQELKEIKRPVYIALDELPDAILRIKKKYDAFPEANSTQILSDMLSSLRSLSNEDGLNCKLILLGSSNIIKTLEGLGLEEKINNRDNLIFYAMKHPDAFKLFKEICEVSDVSAILTRYKDLPEVAKFFSNFFTLCTPSDIQYFADSLATIPDPSIDHMVNLKRAYIALQINDRGASYYQNRLREYYEKSEESFALKILELVAIAEFDANENYPKSELPKALKKSPEIIFPVLKNLQRDMLIEEDADNCLLIYNKPFSFYLYDRKKLRKPWDHQKV